MTHQTSHYAARRYRVGTMTFRELDVVTGRDGLRRVRVTPEGRIIAEGGHGAHRYTIELDSDRG